MNQQLEVHRARQLLFNNLLRVTHRDYTPLVAAFRDAIDSDPDFISRAMVHVALTGNIRDQVDSAIITLLQSPPQYGYRESGRCLLLGSDVYDIEPEVLPGLPPYRIFRIWQHIRTSDRKVPRLMRGIMSDYLTMLDADPLRFDGIAIRNRAALKSAYWYYRGSVQYSDRTNDILFRDTPPLDSKLAVLKQIANSANPRERARLVVEHRIPFKVAQSVLPKVDAAAGIALLSVMSPTETLNSRAWIERSGILDVDPEVRRIFEEKLEQATASVASADHRRSAQGTDEGAQAAIERAKDAAVAQANRITGEVLIVADHSGSMGRVIDVVPQFVNRIIPLCDDRVFLVWHNDFARVVEVTGLSYSECQRLAHGITAGGGTKHKAALDAALRVGCDPQRIVFLTDGGERVGVRREGTFASALVKSGLDPQMVMIRIPGADPDWLTPPITSAGFHVDMLEMNDPGDYYVFDQVSAVLSGERALSLVERILAVEMSRRRK